LVQPGAAKASSSISGASLAGVAGTVLAAVAIAALHRALPVFGSALTSNLGSLPGLTPMCHVRFDGWQCAGDG
jgi:hypothetical protein